MVLAAISSAQAPAAADATKFEKPLLDRAKALMDAHRYADACEHFAAADRIDPTVGTLLALADCHEWAERPTSSWKTYVEAAARAKAAKDWAREQLAEKRAKALASRVLKLEIVPTTPTKGLAATLDFAPVAAFGTWIEVDPGQHFLEVMQPGMAPFRAMVSGLSAGATVLVPPLEPAKPGEPRFDATGAVRALSMVAYKTCGASGFGKLSLTFAAKGTVATAVFVKGHSFDPAVADCIVARFKAMVAPAGQGGDTLGWSVAL